MIRYRILVKRLVQLNYHVIAVIKKSVNLIFRDLISAMIILHNTFKH